METTSLQLTADGHTLHQGLRVITADLDWGTVDELRPDGWHSILLDSGRRVFMDASRLVYRHPFGDRDPA